MLTSSNGGYHRPYDSDPGEHLATISSNNNTKLYQCRRRLHCHKMVGKNNCNTSTATNNRPRSELNGSSRTHHHSGNSCIGSGTSPRMFRNLDENEQLVLTEEHYWDRLGLIVDHPHCSVCLKNLAVSFTFFDWYLLSAILMSIWSSVLTRSQLLGPEPWSRWLLHIVYQQSVCFWIVWILFKTL